MYSVCPCGREGELPFLDTRLNPCPEYLCTIGTLDNTDTSAATVKTEPSTAARPATTTTSTITLPFLSSTATTSSTAAPPAEMPQGDDPDVHDDVMNVVRREEVDVSLLERGLDSDNDRLPPNEERQIENDLIRLHKESRHEVSMSNAARSAELVEEERELAVERELVARHEGRLHIFHNIKSIYKITTYKNRSHF